MPSHEPFTFGIALIARASTHNWRLVEALLDLTLTSVRAQRDPDFTVVIAGHDRPRTAPDDPRITFVEVGWPAHHPGPHNADSGRKKRAISEFVLARGGGLLMLLDADDWVDRYLVETARGMIGRHQIGALIESGLITDFHTLRAATLPHPRVFDRAFHRICGSCSIARLQPDEADPLRRDPCTALRSHHEWVEAAQAHGAELARLPASGNYIINTSENHSEVHGPYAAWRRELAARVNREGHVIDGAAAARFGLSLDQIRATSSRFFQRHESTTTE